MIRGTVTTNRHPENTDTGGLLTYDDRQSDLYTAIDGFSLKIDGALTQGGKLF